MGPTAPTEQAEPAILIWISSALLRNALHLPALSIGDFMQEFSENSDSPISEKIKMV